MARLLLVPEPEGPRSTGAALPTAIYPIFLTYPRIYEKSLVASRMSPDWTIQDWGITYDEFENDYWRAEQLMGISGKAGNLRGQLQEGGNIFEGPRQHEYPTPPLTPTYTMGFFHKAATQLGYHPFPLPAANLSQAYTNPDNVSRPGCVFCGYCPTHGCMIGAKAQPTNTIMPVLSSRNNFVLRNNCWVRKIVHRNGKAEGVMYMDENGEETFQPAEVVVLSAWTPNSVRLLLLSDIGEKYDPVTAKGTLGKNLTHQVTSGALGMLVFKERLNLFMGSGAVGYGISDLDGDIKQEVPENILRGGAFLRGAATGEGPAGSFGRIPRGAAPRNWGAAWKKAAIEHWDRIGPGVEMRGDHFAYRQNFMDLDPTYTDKWGDPLVKDDAGLDRLRDAPDGIWSTRSHPDPGDDRPGFRGHSGQGRASGCLSSLQRRPILNDAYPGRSDHGSVSRAKRRQPLASALEGAESFCGRLVVLPAKFFCESNAYDRSGQSPGGRWID